MKNNTAMPVITFGQGTDYDALHSLLHLTNKALGTETGGITWNFHLDDGRIITGAFVTNDVAEVDGELVDRTTIARHEAGIPTGDLVTVPTDGIVLLEYL